MFLIFATSIYTSRVILRTLGVADYGIYNVVGGVITMFSFLSGAMSTSTQRYIIFYLGKGDDEELKKVFNMALLIHGIIALAILVLGETVGIWFVLNKLVIPADRMNAAMWVYQLSILASVVTITNVPYSSDIIAHEKMTAFAYISIVEVVLKLAIVFSLLAISFDKLKVYAVLIFCVTLTIQLIYRFYCNRHFPESRLKFYHNKQLFKEMFGFAGWNLCGNLAGVLFGQGLNILLNLFFGPAVNAARGISVQVQGAITQFSTNFQMAINPQITKTYATGQYTEMHKLLYRSSKFSFFCLLFLSLPVVMETPAILKLWLGVVPEYTSIFIKIMLACTIVDATARPLMIAAAATGKVKVYQTVIGGILLAIVPISYVCLKFGAPPWAVFVVHFTIEIIAFFARLVIVRPMIKLSLTEFFKNTIFRIGLVFVFAFPIPVFLHLYMPNGLIRVVTVIVAGGICVVGASYLLGLTAHEKEFVHGKFKTIVAKFKT